jgi:hypothetical protein
VILHHEARDERIEGEKKERCHDTFELSSRAPFRGRALLRLDDDRVHGREFSLALHANNHRQVYGLHGLVEGCPETRSKGRGSTGGARLVVARSSARDADFSRRDK